MQQAHFTPALGDLDDTDELLDLCRALIAVAAPP